MNYTTTLIYTHTDYKYLWEISFDLLKVANPTDKYIVLLNKNHNSNILDYFKFDRIIEYDEILSYSDRILSCLIEIKETHVLFTHEHNIITNCEKKSIDKLFEYMKNKDIVRIGLYIWEYYENKPYINIYEDIGITRSDNSNEYPYSVSPSIWNINKWINILQTFPGKTYRNIEDQDVQRFCSKLNIYTLVPTEILGNIKKIISGFIINYYFQFIHLTHKGCFLSMSYHKELKDLANELIKIYNIDINHKF